MKLLIIDDEKSIRNTLKEILEFEGHKVEVAADGVEGFEKATSENYDVIFSDITVLSATGIKASSTRTPIRGSFILNWVKYECIIPSFVFSMGK